MRFNLPALIVAISVPTLVHLQSSPDTPEGGLSLARTGADVSIDERRSGNASSGQELRPVYLDPERRIYPAYRGVTPFERRDSRFLEDSREPLIRRYRPSFRRRRPYSRRRFGRPRRRPPVPSRRGTYRRRGERRRPFYDPYSRDYERSYDSERYRRRRRYRPRSRIRSPREYYPRDRDEDRREYSPRYRDGEHRPRDEAYADLPRDDLGYRDRSFDDERFGRRRRRGYADSMRVEYREGRRLGTGRRGRGRRTERDYLGDRSYFDERPRDSYRRNRSASIDTRRDYRDLDRGRLIDERLGDRRLSERRVYGRSDRYRHGRYSSTDTRETVPVRTDNIDTLRSFREYPASDAGATSLENYSPVTQIQNNSNLTDSSGEIARLEVTDNLILPKGGTVGSNDTPTNDSRKDWPPKGDGYITNISSVLDASVNKQNDVSSSANLQLHGSDIIKSQSNLEFSSPSKENIVPRKSVKLLGLKENSIVRDTNQATDAIIKPSSENSIISPPEIKNANPKQNRKVGASNTFQKKHPLFMNIPMPTGVHSAMIVDLSQEAVKAKSNRTQNTVLKPAYNVRQSDSILIPQDTDKRLIGISKSAINGLSIQNTEIISSPLRPETHQSNVSDILLDELSIRDLPQDASSVKLPIGTGGEDKSPITTQLSGPRLEPPVRSQKGDLPKSVREIPSPEKTPRNDREPGRDRIRQIASPRRLSEPRRSYRDERTISDVPLPERPLRDELLPRRRRLPPRERYREIPLRGEGRVLRPPRRTYREGDVPFPERRLREERRPSRRRIPSSRRYRDEVRETEGEILTSERRLEAERLRRLPPRRIGDESDAPLRERPLRVKRPYPRRRLPPSRRFEDESDAPPLKRPSRRRLSTRRRYEDELAVAPERPLTDERPLSRRRLPVRRRPYRDDASRPESDVRRSETPIRDERPLPPRRLEDESDETLPERSLRDDRPSARRRLTTIRRYEDELPVAPERPLTDERPLPRRRLPVRRRLYRDDLSRSASDDRRFETPIRDERPPSSRRFEDESDAPSLERPLRDERPPARRRLSTRRRYEDDVPVAPERPLTDERPLPRRRLPVRRRPYRDESLRPGSDARPSERPIRDDRPPRDRRILRRRRPLRDEPRRRYLPPRRISDEPSAPDNLTLPSETGIRDEDPPLRRFPVSDSGEEFPMPRRRRLTRRIIPPESRPPPLERRYRDEVYRRRRLPLPADERYREESRRRRTFSRSRTDRREFALPRRRSRTYIEGPGRSLDETYPEDTATPRRLRSRESQRLGTSLIESSSFSRDEASRRDTPAVSTEELSSAGDTPAAPASILDEAGTPAP